MSRYIDAEVLIHRFDEIAEGKIQRIVGINCKSIEDKMSQIVRVEMEKGEKTTFANFVNTIPTAEAVEVVRCKDCESYNGHRWCYYFAQETGDNDYCSYGKKVE